jgi:hypothetical protein
MTSLAVAVAVEAAAELPITLNLPLFMIRSRGGRLFRRLPLRRRTYAEPPKLVNRGERRGPASACFRLMEQVMEQAARRTS